MKIVWRLMSYNICPWALLGLSVRFLSYRNLESATNYFYNKIEANIKNMDLSQEPFLKSLFELDNLSYKDKVMTAMDIFLGGIDAVRLFIFFLFILRCLFFCLFLFILCCCLFRRLLQLQWRFIISVWTALYKTW